jgi:hypothetical protein
MSKNPSYKNIHNSTYKNINDSDSDMDFDNCQYLISYNNTPHLIVNNENDLHEYMNEHIQNMFNNVYYNNIINSTYFHQPKIIEKNYGYEIIETNTFNITSYDNVIASLTYQKVNSI